MSESEEEAGRSAAAAPAGAEGRDDAEDTLLERYWQTRDASLREAILARYGRLIQSLARKFARGDVLIEDLVQVASIAFLGALQRFNPERGVKFATFAVSTMVGEIKHHFRDHTWSVKVPRYLQELSMKLPRAEESLTLSLGRPPTVADMAEHCRTTEETVLEAMALGPSYHALSLDTPIEFAGGEGTDRIQDQMGAIDPAIEAVTEHASLMTALGALDERKQVIVKRRFFDECSQSEVARELGISQMQVSRLERQALAELRAAIRSEYAPVS